MNIIFEAKERTREIDLPTLKETVSLAEYDGKLPDSRPLEHYQLIDDLSEIAYKKGYNFNLDHIYVSKSESNRLMVFDPENQGLPKSYILRRVVTRLNIVDASFNTAAHNTSIAIGYNERGIQIAFGTNVKVCSNMCIFGERYMTTYGDNKMPFDKMMELVNTYINQLPDICSDDFRILNRMYDHPVNDNDIITAVGEMQLNAVRGAYFGGDSPLNIGEVSTFSKGLLKQHGNILEAEPESRIMSLYDFYNMGTEILHPQRAEISSVWPNVSSWGNFVVNHFNLN